MPGDVGAVATFLNTVAEFFMDPTGYEQLSRERKLKTIREGFNAAVDAKAWDAVDRFLAEYRRLSEQTGP